MVNNRGPYLLVLKHCLSKFCCLLVTKTKSADEMCSILPIYNKIKGHQNFCRPAMGPSSSKRLSILYVNLWM